MAKKTVNQVLLFVLPFLFAVPLVLYGIFESQAVRSLGRPGANILLAVLIVALVAVFLVPFIGMFAGLLRGEGPNFFWAGGRRARAILATGRQAQATVMALGECSQGGVVSINDQPYLNLKLKIDGGSQPPYEVSFDTIVPRAAVPQFQPGAVFPVRVDLNDPRKVVYDSAKQAGFGETDADTGHPVVGGKGWSELDRDLLKKEGKNGKAKIVAVEDTGRSEDFNPVVRITYEVSTPSEPPYPLIKEIPIPTQAVRQLRTVIGRTYPARIHPYDPNKIVVDVKF